jgi:hypothetical protein
VRVERIVSEFKYFFLSIEVCEVCQECETCQNKQTYSSHTILTHKIIISPNFQLFHPSNFMRLTFHCDCEKLIFDWISWNIHLNRMGRVSLWSRSKILSYELKLIFSSFGRICIVRAWIFGCSSHVHQVWEFEKLWITSGLEIKYMTYPYEYSTFQNDFITCNFQAIFLWPFTSPQASSLWIFKSS